MHVFIIYNLKYVKPIDLDRPQIKLLSSQERTVCSTYCTVRPLPEHTKKTLWIRIFPPHRRTNIERIYICSIILFCDLRWTFFHTYMFRVRVASNTNRICMVKPMRRRKDGQLNAGINKSFNPVQLYDVCVYECVYLPSAHEYSGLRVRRIIRSLVCSWWLQACSVRDGVRQNHFRCRLRTVGGDIQYARQCDMIKVRRSTLTESVEFSVSSLMYRFDFQRNIW